MVDGLGIEGTTTTTATVTGTGVLPPPDDDGAAGLDGSARPGAPSEEPTPVVERVYRIVGVASLEVALPDQFPVLTLEDAESGRERLAFRIGTAEGVALAHVLGGSFPARPLTHDLFALALERCGVEIVAVRLTGRVGATYFAELELAGPAGRQVLSCRPSDGICLALRQRVAAPVLCDERLFATSGDVSPDAPAADPTAAPPAPAPSPD